MSLLNKLLIPVGLLLLFPSCSITSQPSPEPGACLLGFTPFPHEISLSAMEYAYEKIATDANIVCHHFDNGVPWPEALAGTALPAELLDDWNYRKSHTPPGHKLYVAVTPINFERNGLAAYRAQKDNLPLPAPWHTYRFNHPDVQKAYLNFCRQVIEFFQPDFLNIGIEANLLMHNAPALWSDYLQLHSFVYRELKKDYPQLPVLVSLTGMDLIDGYTDADHSGQTQALKEIMAYSDWYGLSLHTFMSKFLTESIPSEMFAKIFTLSSKPIAVCETSYPAEKMTVFGETIRINGSEARQEEFFRKLFAAADSHDVRFIINFVIRDYDTLWQQLGSPDSVLKIWRDIGFYNQDGEPRPVLKIWQARLKNTRLR